MNNIFENISKLLKNQNLNIINKEIEKPWGGFFVISEDNAQDFSNIYFNGLNTDRLKVSLAAIRAGFRPYVKTSESFCW